MNCKMIELDFSEGMFWIVEFLWVIIFVIIEANELEY